MKNKICKLCNEKSDLIGKSHILPKWLVHDLKNDKNEVVYSLEIHSDKTIRKNTQSGFHEGNILCKKCDGNIIGALDTYAAKNFFRKDFSSLIQYVKLPNQTIFAHVLLEENDFDFSTLKLFLISILFRCSISQLKEFDNITLKRYENIARKMLLEQNAHSDYFDFVMLYPQVPPSPVVGEPHYAEKALTIPILSRENNILYYIMTIAGIEVWIKPTNRQCPSFIFPLKCKTSHLLIPVTPFEKSFYSYISEFPSKNPVYGLSGKLINI